MIVKNIISNRIFDVETLRISAFRPKGLKNILEQLPLDNYVLGVGYQEGDYQICISGRRKKGESIESTIIRETYEELGLISKFKPQIMFSTNRNFFTKIDIRDTVCTGSTDLSHGDEDDTTERAIVCIYGPLEDIQKYFKKVTLPVNNIDSITHIWSDTVENLIKYF